MAVEINPEEIAPNTVNSDEFGRVNGVTSPIQTQINTKFDDVVGIQNDLLIRGASAWEAKTQAEMIAIIHNMRKYTDYCCDLFTLGTYDMFYRYTTGGGGASIVEGGHFGTGNVGVFSIYGGPGIDYGVIFTHNTHFMLSGGLFYIEFGLRETTYAGVTDGTIVTWVGLLDVFDGTAPTDGLFFEHTNSNNNWFIDSYSAGVHNGGGAKDTGISAQSGAGVTLAIAVNADASEAHFYINGVECGNSPFTTAGGDLIPTGSLGLAVIVNKTVNASGTNTHYVAIDRIDMKYFFTNERK